MVVLSLERNLKEERRLWAQARLKGQCQEIFCFWFFVMNQFPPAPEYLSRTVPIFFENSRRYSHVKVRLIPVSKQNNENFYDWRFFHFSTGVNDTGGAPWAANISRIFEKIQPGPNGILRGLEETDSWKKPEVETLVTLSL